METLPLLDPCSFCGCEESEIQYKGKQLCSDCYEEAVDIDNDETFSCEFLE